MELWWKAWVLEEIEWGKMVMGMGWIVIGVWERGHKSGEGAVEMKE